jgi:hypothetical protein
MQTAGAGDVGVGHAAGDALAARDARGIPPAIAERLDECSWIRGIALLEELGEREKPVGRAPARPESPRDITDARPSHQRNATQFRFRREPRVEYPAIELPSEAVRRVDERMLARDGRAPRGGRAVERLMPLRAKRFPHADLFQQPAPNRRQRLAEPRLAVRPTRAAVHSGGRRGAARRAADRAAAPRIGRARRNPRCRCPRPG